MHDHWLALIAAKHGAVFYYDQPTILYRQHANNVVGGAAFNKSHFYKLKKPKANSWNKRAHQGSLVMREAMGDKRGKIKFFSDCIWPYFHEKKIIFFYLYFFSFFLVSKIFMDRLKLNEVDVILVNATALSSGGALTIFRQFISHAALTNKNILFLHPSRCHSMYMPILFILKLIPNLG